MKSSLRNLAGVLLIVFLTACSGGGGDGNSNGDGIPPSVSVSSNMVSLDSLNPSATVQVTNSGGGTLS